MVGPHGDLLHGHVIHIGAVALGGSSWDGKLYALVPKAGQSWEVKVERLYKHRKNLPADDLLSILQSEPSSAWNSRDKLQTNLGYLGNLGQFFDISRGATLVSSSGLKHVHTHKKKTPHFYEYN